MSTTSAASSMPRSLSILILLVAGAAFLAPGVLAHGSRPSLLRFKPSSTISSSSGKEAKPAETTSLEDKERDSRRALYELFLTHPSRALATSLSMSYSMSMPEEKPAGTTDPSTVEPTLFGEGEEDPLSFSMSMSMPLSFDYKKPPAEIEAGFSIDYSYSFSMKYSMGDGDDDDDDDDDGDNVGGDGDDDDDNDNETIAAAGPSSIVSDAGSDQGSTQADSGPGNTNEEAALAGNDGTADSDDGEEDDLSAATQGILLAMASVAVAVALLSVSRLKKRRGAPLNDSLSSVDTANLPAPV